MTIFNISIPFILNTFTHKDIFFFRIKQIPRFIFFYTLKTHPPTSQKKIVNFAVLL